MILIRNSENINGLNISGDELLLSQYADGTTFIVDGSSKSLEYTLKILDANASGLKINYLKLKLIWIGSKKVFKRGLSSIKMETRMKCRRF